MGFGAKGSVCSAFTYLHRKEGCCLNTYVLACRDIYIMLLPLCTHMKHEPGMDLLGTLRANMRELTRQTELLQADGYNAARPHKCIYAPCTKAFARRSDLQRYVILKYAFFFGSH